MSKPIFTMMCGLVASGKSYYATRLTEEINATVFSSDALREEMFGDINDQDHNSEVFEELHKRIKDCLKSGKNAIYDATNISSKKRRAFIQELSKIDCEKRCVIMATPYEQCLVNNSARDRKVPEEVIDRMYRNWNTPYWFEGWGNIEIVYWEDTENNDSVWRWLNDHMEYGQDNPHHDMTLGQHCWETSGALADEDPLNGIMRAGLLHDCGKPYVKTFTNAKGEVTDVAHYYSHENVGAYDVLFYDCGAANPLDVSILVNLHMRPYIWEKDDNTKLRDKHKKLWGEELFSKVMLLHEADKAAH